MQRGAEGLEPLRALGQQRGAQHVGLLGEAERVFGARGVQLRLRRAELRVEALNVCVRVRQPLREVSGLRLELFAAWRLVAALVVVVLIATGVMPV